MRSSLRVITVLLIPLLFIGLCLSVAGPKVVPLFKGGKVSLVPDTCSKAGHSVSTPIVVVVGVVFTVLVFFPLVGLLGLKDDPIPIRLLPEGLFRPPCQ